jgi:hypothetical protein
MPVVVVVPVETQVLPEEREALEVVVPEALSEPALAREVQMVRVVLEVEVVVVATTTQYLGTQVVQVVQVL